MDHLEDIAADELLQALPFVFGCSHVEVIFTIGIGTVLFSIGIVVFVGIVFVIQHVHLVMAISI